MNLQIANMVYEAYKVHGTQQRTEFEKSLSWFLNRHMTKIYDYFIDEI